MRLVQKPRTLRRRPKNVAPAGPPPPAQIGPFKLGAFLGKGGTADVYEARSGLDGATFALKIQAVPSDRDAARFTREFAALDALEHPAIPKVFGQGALPDGRRHIAMALLHGQSGRAWARRLPPPGAPDRTRRIVRMAQQVLSALDALHAQAMVHGDIKPSNLLISSPDDGVHLLDFGGVQSLTPGRTTEQPTGFFGTYAYSAPEQLRCEAIDTRADLYAFGATLFRLLSGRRAYEAKSRAEAIAALNRRRPALLDIAPGIPPELATLIAELMALNPSDRPISAAILAQRLQGIEATLG